MSIDISQELYYKASAQRSPAHKLRFASCSARSLPCFPPAPKKTGGAGTGKPASPSAGTGRYVLFYDVYLGGLKLLKAEMEIRRTPGTQYDIKVKSNTTGLARLITPWEGTITAKGRYNENGLPVPRLYKSESIWPENRITKRFTYNEDGTLDTLEITDREKPDLELPDKKLGDQTRDLLSTLLYFAETVTGDQTCDHKVEVFDAKRRFRLDGETEEAVALESSRYNIYEGPALHCDFSMVPMGGRWHETLKGWMAGFYGSQYEDDRPSVWFGRIDEAGLAVPVKMRAKVKYGTAFAHLKKITAVPAHEEKTR